MRAYYPIEIGPIQVPAYSAATVQEAEKPLLEAGFPLMMRASAALAQVALGTLDLPGHPRQVLRTLILVGSGNNGGDALYAGAAIADEGVEVDVVTVADHWHEGGMSAALAERVRHFTAEEFLRDLAGRGAELDYDLILDGILGTGTGHNPALRGRAAETVAALAARMATRDAESVSRPRVIAVDIPSGLHPNTGEATSPMLNADTTVTFGAPKIGLARGAGPSCIGRLVFADIGLSSSLRRYAAEGATEVAVIVDATTDPNYDGDPEEQR